MTPKKTVFSKDTKFAELLTDDRRLLQLLTRFGIGLGFGDRSVAQVCQMNHANTELFLMICEIYSDSYFKPSPRELQHIDMRDIQYYEEEVVFPYIEALLNGQRTDSYKIDEFEHNHTNIQDVLDDMMNILLKYLPGDILPKERIEISYDIMELSDDLNRHSLIEERILVPCVESLENAQP